MSPVGEKKLRGQTLSAADKPDFADISRLAKFEVRILFQGIGVAGIVEGIAFWIFIHLDSDIEMTLLAWWNVYGEMLVICVKIKNLHFGL